MAVANIHDPEFGSESERTGFAARRAKLGEQAGAEHLGASLYELAPGSAPFPLHYHLANEELLIAIDGELALRSTSGERALEPGEVVACPVGAAGAHQVVNRGREPARVLIISEMNAPDIVVRPESGKLSAFGRAPGSSAEGMHEVFVRNDATEFWAGEEPPPGPETA